MEAIDSVYENAGYHAALALWAALTGLGIPLIVALAGVAWRFLRMAEDGLVRPLLFYLFGLVILWWLVTPGSVPQTGTKAPRFTVLLTKAVDGVASKAFWGINKRFHDHPFEWERLAAMCGLIEIHDDRLAGDVKAFYGECTLQSVGLNDGHLAEGVLRNPLSGDSYLTYTKLHATLGYGRKSPEKVLCQEAKEQLLKHVRAYVRASDEFKRVKEAARNLGDDLPEDLYVDQLVANTLHGTAKQSDAAVANLAVGTFQAGTAAQNSFRALESANQWWPLKHISRGVDFVISIAKPIGETVKIASETKARHFVFVTAAPQIYGVVVMMLLALFPFTAVWSLLPGRWTALVSFAKVYLSVKMWPIGWCVLTSFTEYKKVSEAVSVPGKLGGGVENVFVAVSLMYFVVPALSFIIVQTVTTAAALPFKQLMPGGGGGGGGGGAHAVATIARVAAS